MDFENRIVAPEYDYKEDEAELSLRPKTLNEYIGQKKAKENLSIYIKAALGRHEELLGSSEIYREVYEQQTNGGERDE